MKTNRPKIEVPLSALDIILDLVSVAILLGMIIYSAFSFTDLPEIIPSHFNASGEVDGHSKKYVLWLLPAIGCIIFMGLFILNKFPHLHNYMVNITEENALKNYKFSTRIVRITNLFVMITFGIILFTMIQTAQGNSLKLNSWVLPIIIGFSIILPIAIFIFQKKNM